MVEPLTVDATGTIVLTDTPGMGYAPNEAMLAKTRVG